jgi:hypothetical protein
MGLWIQADARNDRRIAFTIEVFAIGEVVAERGL